MNFTHRPHPHIEHRKTHGPPKHTDEHVGFNGRIALHITKIVGTMWMAYIFAFIALVSLPQAIVALQHGDTVTGVSWLSQSFIQLVLLPVIIVGQNIQGAASDKRAEMTYKDAEATFHEAQQIQDHLTVQDAELEKLIAAITGRKR